MDLLKQQDELHWDRNTAAALAHLMSRVKPHYFRIGRKQKQINPDQITVVSRPLISAIPPHGRNRFSRE